MALPWKAAMFPQIFGKYVLEREIAAGGMARVYLATLRGAVGFEKRLVVKQIRTELASDEAFVTRFVEEAKTAVELSHPNIVPVYELGVEQGVYYIAMELCEGLTLSEVLAETGPLSAVEGAYVGAEICRALDYAHRRARIVHRDVTPRNVLLDDEGAVRLIDFGIAAPVTLEGDAARSEVFGSPGHMPPEQLHGAELTPATDVFAVGVLLIEAWTGYPPFRRASARESERALFTVPPRVDLKLPELAPISALIASSVALEARERPAGAEQLARPLREFLRGEDTGDLARRLAERVRRARRRSRSSSPWLVGETGPPKSSQNTRPMNGESTPATPSSAPVTRTFAASENLEEWTRKLSSPPSGPPSVAVPEDAAPSGISSSKHSSRAPTRSTGLAALAALGIGALAVLIALSPRAPAPRTLAIAPTATAPSPRASAVPEPSVVSAPLKVAPMLKAAPKKPLHATPAPSAVVSPEAEQFGVLKITADPGALVEINGPHFHQQARSPIAGLRVPVGKYAIVFRNDTFGAALSTQASVLAGVTRSVHADFRQAEPTVSVR